MNVKTRFRHARFQSLYSTAHKQITAAPKQTTPLVRRGFKIVSASMDTVLCAIFATVYTVIPIYGS